MKLTMDAIRKMSEDELMHKMHDARVELGRLQTDGAKGTLRKESGNIRATKKNIARMMTRQNEMRNDDNGE